MLSEKELLNRRNVGIENHTILRLTISNNNPDCNNRCISVLASIMSITIWVTDNKNKPLANKHVVKLYRLKDRCWSDTFVCTNPKRYGNYCPITELLDKLKTELSDSINAGRFLPRVDKILNNVLILKPIEQAKSDQPEINKGSDGIIWDNFNLTPKKEQTETGKITTRCGIYNYSNGNFSLFDSKTEMVDYIREQFSFRTFKQMMEEGKIIILAYPKKINLHTEQLLSDVELLF